MDLREAPYLTDLQVTEAIQLWTALPDTDKQRVNYQPRHQPQLTHGRFKAPKRSGVTPGVESVKRCLIGHPGVYTSRRPRRQEFAPPGGLKLSRLPPHPIAGA